MVALIMCLFAGALASDPNPKEPQLDQFEKAWTHGPEPGFCERSELDTVNAVKWYLII